MKGGTLSPGSSPEKPLKLPSIRKQPNHPRRSSKGRKKKPTYFSTRKKSSWGADQKGESITLKLQEGKKKEESDKSLTT